MPAPSTLLTWMSGQGAPQVQFPSNGKQTAGWQIDERPAREFMNALFQNAFDWISYLNSVYSQVAGVTGIYQGYVGVTNPLATYASINAAVAALPAGSRILVLESAVLNTIQAISKNDFEVNFVAGVTYSKGTASSAIQVQASGVKIKGGRFTGFNGVSDIALLIDAGSAFTMYSEMRFNGNTTNVTDNNGTGANDLIIEET